MDYNIRSQFKRSLEKRRGKGVVAYYLDILIVAMGGLGYGRDVGYFQIGVGRSLKINGNGILFKMRLYLIYV